MFSVFTVTKLIVNHSHVKMILIPKIKESVTWIVYKRNGYRIESNKKYTELLH